MSSTSSPGSVRYGQAVRERSVGSSGLTVSVVGLGCNNFGWRIDEARSRAVVDASIEEGITLFDTAESYGDGLSEQFLGRALAGRRESVVIATKFGWGKGVGDMTIARGAPTYVRQAIERSLANLGTDYIDLYQYHRPDGVTPLEETLGALDELVREGKVRWIGSSNLSAAQIREADRTSAERGIARFVSAQNNYSWLERESEVELIPVCAELGIGFIPYFPLARGLLTGKYRHDGEWPEGTRIAAGSEVPAGTWRRIESLDAFARDHEVGLLDVAIGGLAAQPAVCSVIAGATTPEQVRANAAAGGWEPTEAELAALVAL
jgi:aryl-alcohol dehydrogenase-like predicted oxidoreductase